MLGMDRHLRRHDNQPAVQRRHQMSRRLLTPRMQSTVFQIVSTQSMRSIVIGIFLIAICFSICTLADPMAAVLATLSVRIIAAFKLSGQCINVKNHGVVEDLDESGEVKGPAPVKKF